MFLVQFYAFIPLTSCDKQLCFLDCASCVQKKKAVCHITQLSLFFYFDCLINLSWVFTLYTYIDIPHKCLGYKAVLEIFPFTDWEPLCKMCTGPKHDHITSSSILFGSIVCFEGPWSPLLLPLVKVVRAVLTPFQSFVCAVFICCNTNMFSHLGPLAKV